MNWGNWHHNPANQTLEYISPNGYLRYYIDLGLCTTCASVLTAADRSDMLVALNEILAPQRTLCRWAITKDHK
jgi:hypothetical protein